MKSFSITTPPDRLIASNGETLCYTHDGTAGTLSNVTGDLILNPAGNVKLTSNVTVDTNEAYDIGVGGVTPFRVKDIYARGLDLSVGIAINTVVSPSISVNADPFLPTAISSGTSAVFFARFRTGPVDHTGGGANTSVTGFTVAFSKSVGTLNIPIKTQAAFNVSWSSTGNNTANFKGFQLTLVDGILSNRNVIGLDLSWTLEPADDPYAGPTIADLWVVRGALEAGYASYGYETITDGGCVNMLPFTAYSVGYEPTFTRWTGIKLANYSDEAFVTLGWGINCDDDIQVLTGRKIILEGSFTAKGDTYFVYDSVGATLDCFVNGTEVWNAHANYLETTRGRKKNISRFTTTQTLDATHHNAACDTDGGAFTVTLPAGVAGTEYRIMNTGTSGNALTIAPNGSELLIGVNANFTLNDGEALVIVYEATEGWY